MMLNDETNRNCYIVSLSLSFTCSLLLYLSLCMFLFCVTVHYDYDYDLIKSLCVIMRVVLFSVWYTNRILFFFPSTALVLHQLNWVCLFPIPCIMLPFFLLNFPRLISSFIVLIFYYYFGMKKKYKQTKNANAEENISFFVFYWILSLLLSRVKCVWSDKNFLPPFTFLKFHSFFVISFHCFVSLCFLLYALSVRLHTQDSTKL